MPRINLNVGTNANDGTGDTLRDAMINVNTMFTEVYNSPGISSDTLTFTGNEISAVTVSYTHLTLPTNREV